MKKSVYVLTHFWTSIIDRGWIYFAIGSKWKAEDLDHEVQLWTILWIRVFMHEYEFVFQQVSTRCCRGVGGAKKNMSYQHILDFKLCIEDDFV